jgi:WD40 repeat protein
MQSVLISHARTMLMVAIAGLVMFGLKLAHSAEEAAAVATEKPSGVSPSERAATLTFERDPTQLVATNPAEIWALAFSGNDKFLAAAGGGGRDSQGSGLVRVWDFGNAKEVAAYPTPRGDLNVTLSPDGRRVAWSSYSGEVRMYEVGGRELLRPKFGLPSRTAFSPDGLLLAAGAEGTRLELWDVTTGKQLHDFPDNNLSIFWLGFSPDGKYMVAGAGPRNFGDNVQAVVWDVETRQQRYAVSDNPEPVEFVAISPDSKTMATSGGNSIVLRDMATGARRGRTEETKSPVTRIVFSPDGSLMASAGKDRNDGVVTLWGVPSGKVVGTLTGHVRDVRALAFTHDGKTLATGGGDRSIRLWKVATRQQTGMLQEPTGLSDPKGETAEILAVAYSPDGNSVATASEDGLVSVHGLAQAGPVRSWMAHADAAAALAYSSDGQMLVSGGYDKVIKFWNPATGELVRTLEGHKGWVMSLAFSHDGQTLASGSYDRSIRLWNVADGVERRKLVGHTATVRSLAFSHDDKLLASGSADHTVRLWDVASGQEQVTLAGHDGGVRSVAFSPDDRLLASGGEDHAIKLWNVDSHDLRGTLTGHTDIVSAVAFARETLVSKSWDQKLRTWDVTARQMHGDLDTGTSVVALAVAPDGNRLLTAGAGQSLALWKAKVVESQPTTNSSKPTRAAEEAK